MRQNTDRRSLAARGRSPQEVARQLLDVSKEGRHRKRSLGGSWIADLISAARGHRKKTAVVSHPTTSAR